MLQYYLRLEIDRKGHLTSNYKFCVTLTETLNLFSRVLHKKGKYGIHSKIFGETLPSTFQQRWKKDESELTI